MKSNSCFLLLLLITACVHPGNNQKIDIAGDWHFRIDSLDKGIDEKWFDSDLNESVRLPGSMTENGKGNEITVKTKWTGEIVDSSWFKSASMEKYRQSGHIKIPFWLQPEKYYTGRAWYQKEVNIPRSWKGRHIELFLERCHWETRVWVDDNGAGMQNSLGTPHIYDLTSLLKPGKHRITLCIDNRIRDINVGPNSHSISDHTQTNWNGIVGKLELHCMDVVYISDIRLYPDLRNKTVKTTVYIENSLPDAGKATIQLACRPETEGLINDLKEQNFKQELVKGTNIVTFDYPMGDHFSAWDEFNPFLYKMTVKVKDEKGNRNMKTAAFGMREFKSSGTQFTVNGRKTFLRGTLECAIFPLTGYPSTDTASWGRIFRIADSHGLNHMRFHSWCPPEAAFEAADHAGFYLEVECSSWANSGATIGDGTPLDQYLYDESERMIKMYGNHPSFCMMLYGNEPAGENQDKWLTGFINYWKNKDSRRLYSSGSGWPLLPETDFNSTAIPRIQGWGEGLSSIINAREPGMDFDWTSRLPDQLKPTISHEIGQWCVYPDLKETTQYKGVLKARNFEIFAEKLRENHMENLADSFLFASGKLQSLCYKADIEAALRTPGFGGFQLLDLHDFPGQGTALVGVLNPFWNEKGYISPEEYRQFCNSTVLLIRSPRMICTSDETLRIPVEIAHFGAADLKSIESSWRMIDKRGMVVYNGKFNVRDIPTGSLTPIGTISQPLKDIHEAQKLVLEILAGDYKNHWDFWVYPAKLPGLNDDILVTRTLDHHALEVLKGGGRVLMCPSKRSLKAQYGGDIAVGFSSIFWNTAWTNKQPPHTLGILCNPEHPALAEFPTEFHSNWQWWDAMSHANAIDLSGLPAIKPIVRIIDDWFTNRPLALIFEARAGQGKLLVCSTDILSDLDQRPEARQLLYSLKKYMSGSSFDPSASIDPDQFQLYFRK